MAILESLSNIAATLIEALRTRLELVALDVEEASQRFFCYLLLALVALFCLGLAVILAVFLIVVICWDNNRIAAISVLAGFFALAGIGIALGIRHHFLKNPRLLSHTLAELDSDAAALHSQAPK